MPLWNKTIQKTAKKVAGKIIGQFKGEVLELGKSAGKQVGLPVEAMTAKPGGEEKKKDDLTGLSMEEMVDTRQKMQEDQEKLQFFRRQKEELERVTAPPRPEDEEERGIGALMKRREKYKEMEPVALPGGVSKAPKMGGRRPKKSGFEMKPGGSKH